MPLLGCGFVFLVIWLYTSASPGVREVDECAEGSPCEHDCINTVGSYYCSCRHGYALVSGGRCQDVDECYGHVECQQHCTNTVGSYMCWCALGYRLINEWECEDVDECAEGSPCEHYCTNWVGGYDCSCRDGYGMTYEGECQDINECGSSPCEHYCTNTVGSFHCSCRGGYRLISGGRCQVPPKKPVITGFTEPVVAGTNHELTCQAWQEGAGDIQYSWYRDDVQVSSGNTSVLYLAPVKKEDGGVYKCRALNAAGDKKSDPKPLVVYFPNEEVSMSETPTGPIMEGNEKILHCETDESNPVSTIRWYQWIGNGYQEVTVDITTSQDDSNFGGKISKSSLQLTANRTLNQRSYKCVSNYTKSNGTSVIHRAKRQLSVSWSSTKIEMVSKPEKPVKAGDHVTIKCETDSSNSGSAERVQWHRSGKPGNMKRAIISGIQTSSRPGDYGGTVYASQLTFTARKADNQAIYECKTKDPDPFKKATTLTAYFPNIKIFFVSGYSDPAMEGSEKTFQCKTDESNPVSTIRWYQETSSGSQEITTGISSTQENGNLGGKIRTSSLKVKANKTLNGRNYSCKSTYTYGGSGATVEQKAQTPLKVRWSARKMLMVEKPDEPIIVDNQVILKCETDSSNSDPPEKILWFRMRPPGVVWEAIIAGIQTSTRPADYGAKVYVSQLTFAAREEDNQAVYECKTKSQDPHNSTNITVYFPPRVNLTSNLAVVKEHDNVILTCGTTGGNPPPSDANFTWFGKRDQVVGSKSRQFSIKGILYNMSGEYKCRVENDAAVSAESSFSIDVRYAPKWNPDFSEVSKDAVRLLDPAVLNLQVILNPGPPNVTLYKSNTSETVLYKSFYTSISDVGAQAVSISLHFPSVKQDDYGTFIIMVGNNVGQTNFSFSLLAAGPPNIPTDLAIVSKTTISITLTFRPGFYGGSPQTFTIQFWNITLPAGDDCPDANVISEIPDPGSGHVTIKIPGLLPNGTYEFCVKATNDDGTEGYTESVIGTTKESLILNEDEFEARRVGNTVVLTWPPFEYEYTKLQVVYCDQASSIDKPCLRKDIYDANSTSVTFEVEKGKTYSYSLVIYDDADNVFASPFVNIAEPVPPSNLGLTIGIVVGLLLVSALTVTAVVHVLRHRRNKEATEGNDGSNGRTERV